MKIILVFNESIYQHELFFSILRIYTLLSFQLLLRCCHHSCRRPPAPPPPSGPCYIAVYDYTAADDDEISFQEGRLSLSLSLRSSLSLSRSVSPSLSLSFSLSLSLFLFSFLTHPTHSCQLSFIVILPLQVMPL